MLDHPLEGLPGEVQPVPAGIAALQLGHHPEGLNIVIKAAIGLHLDLELIFPGVAEGRMTQIVGQSDGLGEVSVQPHGPGQGAGDLGDFQGMGQAGAEVIAFMGHKDLGLFLQAAEGAGVDDAVAVAGEGGARQAGMLGEPAPARSGDHGGEGR